MSSAETAPNTFCGNCGARLTAPTCARCVAVAELALSNQAAAAKDGHPLRVSFALYGTILLSHMIAAVVISSDPKDPRWSVLIQNITQAWDSLLVLAFACFLAPTGSRLWSAPSKLGSARATRWLWLLIGAISGVFTFSIAWLAVQTLRHFLGGSAEGYSHEPLSIGYGWWYMVLTVVLQPAIIEELAFRGIIQPGMARLMGRTPAVFVSAAMFTVLHISAVNFPHLLVMGVIVGFIRDRCGSVYPGMVLHAVHNGLVILLEYLGSSS